MTNGILARYVPDTGVHTSAHGRCTAQVCRALRLYYADLLLCSESTSYTQGGLMYLSRGIVCARCDRLVPEAGLYLVRDIQENRQGNLAEYVSRYLCDECIDTLGYNTLLDKLGVQQDTHY